MNRVLKMHKAHTGVLDLKADISIKTPDDLRPGTKKGKLDKKQILKSPILCYCLPTYKCFNDYHE